MNVIKTEHEIKKMRIAGKLAAEVIIMIKQYVKEGISTATLNDICHDYIVHKQFAIPACLQYYGFPKSICTSINDVVCHGIPTHSKILKNGDIINIDVAIIKDGYHGDTSEMFIVGKPTKLAKKLCNVVQKSLYLSIKSVKPGIKLRSLGMIIQNYVEKQDFSVVREYCGHGIGKNFHEKPHVMHYNTDDQGFILKKGMIFTIEPMINSGKPDVYCTKDNWTVKTKDRSLSAQYEHTVLVIDNGCEILTWKENEKISPILIHSK